MPPLAFRRRGIAGKFHDIEHPKAVRLHKEKTTMRFLISTIVAGALASSTGFAADAKAGAAVYDKSCKTCHGADGTPNASVAKMMKVEMKDLKSSEVQLMGDDELKKIVTEGKGKMKPAAGVTGAAADNVLAYVKSLKQ
jgi:mono/diheme cytochrome c family protein